MSRGLTSEGLTFTKSKSMQSTRARILALWAVVLLFVFTQPKLLWGQSTTFARLVGTVTDATGGVVPGVEIEVRNQATNIVREVLTGPAGMYIVDKLIPGIYDVTAGIPGFKQQVHSGVRLEVYQKARLDFLLTPGEIADSIVVTGESLVIDTQSAEIGAVVEHRQIVDLPTKDRDLFQLVVLVPGATEQPAWGRIGGGLPSFNGQPPNSNQITYDGAVSTSVNRAQPVVRPTPETVSEFKIITANYSAEYGRVAGAVINIVSRSGTNEFRGTAWEYWRNDRFDANNFFANRRGLGKLPVSQHDFGIAVGGPIQRDRTFFFGAYEGFRNTFSRPGLMAVPSLAERQGDFSGGGAAFPGGNIYDPFNVVDGERVQFPGNKIPANRIHPIASTINQKFPFPQPNVEGFPNYSYADTSILDRTKASARIDHQLSSDNTLFGRFTWQNAPEIRDGPYPGPPGTPNGVYQGRFDEEQGWQTAVGWIKSFGGNLINEINVGFHWKYRDNEAIDPINWEKEFGFDYGDQVLETLPDGGPGPAGLPSMRITGYARYRGQSDLIEGDKGLGIKETVAWNRGNHYVKLGFDMLRYYEVNQRWVPMSASDTRFNGFGTSQIAGSIGQPFADFLLGTPSRANVNLWEPETSGIAALTSYDKTNYNFFINDDWRIKPNVTLNLGLRYELNLPVTFENNRASCYIDGSQGRFNPVQVVPQGFPIQAFTGGDPSKLSIPHRERDSRSCVSTQYKNFAPRLGIAWRPTGNNRTAIRAGYGVSYDQWFGIMIAATGFVGPYTGFQTVQVQTRDASPALNFGEFLTLDSVASQQEQRLYESIDPNWQEADIHSYNLSFQHEILPRTRLEVAYVGNQARHLSNIRAWNKSEPAGSEIILMTGERVIAAGTEKERRWYPNVQTHLMPHSDGNTSYNSLQTKLERRFGDGIGFSTGWTWGRVFALNFPGFIQREVQNEFDRSAIHGPAVWDRPHTYFASVIWELPFSKNGSPLARALVGGWQATSIVTFASGSPYGLNVRENIFDISGRRLVLPNRVGEGQLPEGQRTVDRFYDVSAFEVPNRADGKFGNSALYPLVTDGIANVDLAFHKAVALGEAREIEFRVELFNAFNHPTFGTPGTAIDVAGAGVVNSASTGRQIQLGLRFAF